MDPFTPSIRVNNAAIEPLQNVVATHFLVTALFSMRTVSLASSKSCRSVDSDPWCKLALTLHQCGSCPRHTAHYQIHIIQWDPVPNKQLNSKTTMGVSRISFVWVFLGIPPLCPLRPLRPDLRWGGSYDGRYHCLSSLLQIQTDNEALYTPMIPTPHRNVQFRIEEF